MEKEFSKLCISNSINKKIILYDEKDDYADDELSDNGNKNKLKNKKYKLIKKSILQLKKYNIKKRVCKNKIKLVRHLINS